MNSQVLRRIQRRKTITVSTLMNFSILRIDQTHSLWSDYTMQFRSAERWLSDPHDRGHYHFLGVVSHEDKLLGGSILDIGDLGFGPLRKVTTGFLEDLEILCEYRRYGIGTKLLQETLDYAWERQCHCVRWTVSYRNEVGIAFYRKQRLAFIPDEDPDSKEPIQQYTVVAINPAGRKKC